MHINIQIKLCIKFYYTYFVSTSLNKLVQIQFAFNLYLNYGNYCETNYNF